MNRCVALVAISAAAVFSAGVIGQSVAADPPGSSQAAPKRNKVIFSVTDNDKGKWNLVLNNATAVQQNVGAKDIDVEVVVWGPGINMLKLESVVGNRVDELIEKGIRVVACETTMHDLKLSPQDMWPTIAYVPGGVIELMQKQQQGWAYVRP
jgi:uncharacterized protein